MQCWVEATKYTKSIIYCDCEEIIQWHTRTVYAYERDGCVCLNVALQLDCEWKFFHTGSGHSGALRHRTAPHPTTRDVVPCRAGCGVKEPWVWPVNVELVKTRTILDCSGGRSSRQPLMTRINLRCTSCCWSTLPCGCTASWEQVGLVSAVTVTSVPGCRPTRPACAEYRLPDAMSVCQ